MSLYATKLDLDREGAPAAALSRVTSSELAQLRAASNKADDYLRGRYTLPLSASADLEADVVQVSGSTGTGSMSVSWIGTDRPTRAYGILVEILSTAARDSATARLSTDGGVSWGASFVLSATVTVSAAYVTLTFSTGTYYDGDVYRVSVSYGSLTTHVVSLAVYGLLKLRGWAPEGGGSDPIRDAYKEALRWLEGVRDLRTDPGLVSAGGTGSDMFQTDPDLDDIDIQPLEQDRRWQSVVGRSATSSNLISGWPE